MGGRRTASGYRGIALRPGKNSIRLIFAYRGVTCRESLPLEPTKANVQYAADLVAEIRRKIVHGSFRYADYFPDSPRADLWNPPARKRTVGDSLRQWLEAQEAAVSAGTLAEYDKVTRRYLIPWFNDHQIANLTTGEVRARIAKLKLNPKTIRNILTPLRGALGEAFADGCIPRNPVERGRIKTKSTPPPEPDPFTPEEVGAILGQLREPQVRNFYQFAFWTGMRPSEAIALRWQDIDWKQEQATVSRARVRGRLKEPKSKAGRRHIRLMSGAIEALRAQKEHTWLGQAEIFHNPRTGKAWATPEKLREYEWGPAIRRAGVRYRPPYQCRHTYASMMLSAGENPAWVSTQMGHAKIAVFFDRYARWIPETNPDAGKRAEALFGSLNFVGSAWAVPRGIEGDTDG